MDDWEQRRLGEIITEAKRPIKMDDNSIYQLVTVKRRNKGIISRGFFKGKDILVKNYYQLNSGDFLISKRQVVHGATGMVPIYLDKAIVSNEYFVSIGNNNITTNFLTILAKLPEMYKMFFLSSYGIDIEKLVFNVADWKKRKMFIPKIDEQVKIGELFNLLDNTIALHQEKLNKLNRLKKGLLQFMFPEDNKAMYPRLRFTDFSEDWEQRKLENLLQERNDKTQPSSDYPLMSFVAYKGVVPKGERYDRSSLVLNKNKKYKRTLYGDFIYSSNNLETGSIGFNQTGNALISPVYSIFQSTDNADSRFIALISTKKRFIYSMIRFRQGVIYGQWRIHEKDFLKIKVNVPIKNEQLEVIIFFERLENIITLHQQKIDKLKQIKKAYLQKMFI
ncbi:restriction endonuclease subunit S [Dellaglioa sp. BT-FLS60]